MRWIGPWMCAGALGLLVCAAAGADEPYPLKLRVGEKIAICKTGTIICPAGAPICDDPEVAVGVWTEEGLAFKGLKPGTTLCSAGSADGKGARRIYRVTVSAPSAR